MSDSTVTLLTTVFMTLFIIGFFCPVPDWFYAVFVVVFPVTICLVCNIIDMFK